MKAFHYLQIGAEAGDSNAQLVVGYMYESGRGVEKDKNKAKMWYERSKALGNKKAEMLLSLLPFG